MWDAGMRDEGCGMQDAGCRNMAMGDGMRGYGIWDAGCAIWAAQCGMQGMPVPSSGAGQRMLQGGLSLPAPLGPVLPKPLN